MQKTIQMVLALAEGVLEADRAHIKDSVSISLMRDVRKGLAAVRFIAVTKNLVVRSGLLGVAGHLHRFGVGAQGLLQTTNHIINNFATANRSTSSENFDNDVRRSLRKHTHMVTVDAASDEVVASEIMRVSASEALSPLTPNVGIVLRDKAHASRRILSRPWKADSYLTEVMDMIASGPDCPAQMIQRSEDIKSQFLLILEAHDPSNKTQNLRAAKHRFESFQKPLGRTIRLFLPIHELMVRLAVRGRETLAKRAKTWLTSISEQPSRLVMAAMLADAADEAMALTRFCDSEGMDVSELPAQISSFLDRVTTLFGPRRYSLECTSYTSTMMHTLQDPIVWAIGTRQQNLRAPTPSELDTCFAHMQAWLILAQQTIQVEFPSWEVAQSFMNFNLEGNVHRLANDPYFKENMGRLALACAVDSGRLAEEFIYHQHHAKQLKSHIGCDAKSAWVRALQEHMTKRKSFVQAHPVSNLHKVVVRWLGFAASTSGVPFV